MLVHSRTRLINHIRGAVRAWGASLPRCTAPTFHRKVAEHIPTELLPARTTLLEVTGDICRGPGTQVPFALPPANRLTPTAGARDRRTRQGKEVTMTTTTSYETVRYETRDRTAIVTLNRPERLNATIPQLKVDVVNAFTEADGDDEVQSIIVTGEGRAFCAGRDMKASENSPGASMTPEQAAASAVYPTIARDVLKPVIAAVNGPARGAGCNLVFTADFRIVSERANFAVNFIERGVVAEYPLFLLSRLIGLQRATEICMLGEVFDAQLAHGWGLTHQLVPHDQLLGAALDLAARLAARAPLAMQETKALIIRLHYLTIEEFDALQREANLRLMETEDWNEGIQAFREKRDPQFRGR